jgi:hypothetical protein
MLRLFGYLAAANLVLVLATAALGFFDPAATADRHVLIAVVTLLITSFVQVLAFTYLTVTGKVIAQAVHLGRLDHSALDVAKGLKRSLTRTLAALVLAIVVVTASGAAAWRSGDPHTYHLPATLVFVGAMVWALGREFGLIAANAQLMDRTLAVYMDRKSKTAG